jgi:hypothetical protein
MVKLARIDLRSKAALAWQTLTGEAITIPAPAKVDIQLISDAALHHEGPARFN